VPASNQETIRDNANNQATRPIGNKAQQPWPGLIFEETTNPGNEELRHVQPNPKT
jgi:hypothetical protein